MSSPVAQAIRLSACLLAVACSRGADAPPAPHAALPQWTYDSTMVFPADRSLTRPEDGVALPDGRLLVADQAHGLRLVETDGTHRPFGEMVAAGYRHEPPAHGGGANGVALEPDGSHVLVADISGGAIYRVDVVTGVTEKLYQHRYGINTAVRDRTGAIWFTQSAQNTPEEGEARMWAAVDAGRREGALFRLAWRDGRVAAEPELKVDSLAFANGIAIDEAAGHLYVAETVGGRVLRYQVDLPTGQLSQRAVFVDSAAADNLELDGEGNLWMALPLVNAVMVVNTGTGARHMAFQSLTPAQADIGAEFMRRGEVGEPRMGLFTPALWEPLPGFITGVIVGPSTAPVYLTGLGNAVLKLAR